MVSPSSSDDVSTAGMPSSTPSLAPTIPGKGVAAGSTVGSRRPASDRYVLLDPVGEGGMGVVWSAYDRELDRKVALKVLHDRFLGLEHQARLRREAQSMARLSHPNVVPVYDVGERDGRTFFTMEFVRGTSLSEWLTTPRDWRAIRRIFVDAARGLVAAHAAGIIHRDFKPSNVLIGEDERVRVADFGVARALSGQVPEPVPAAPATAITIETATGTLIGSPAYMSPEQLRGEVADERSDQFSFCVALYEALCGRRPFEGANIGELAASIERGVPPLTAATPGWLAEVVRRGLSADPAARFPTMAALEAALEGPPQRRHRGLVLALGFAVVAVGATLLVTRPWASDARARAPSCDDAGTPIDHTWGAAQRDAVTAAFAAATGPTDDAARTVAGLDQHAARWRESAIGVCRAARVEQSFSPELHDRALVCLAERRASFGVVVDALAAANPLALRGALTAIGKLPDPSRCTSPAFLVAETLLPEDGARAVQAKELLAEIDTAHAKMIVGDVEAATALLDRLRPQVVALDHPPVSREMSRAEAFLARENGAYEKSRELFETVYFNARAQKAHAALIMTCHHLIWLTTQALGRMEEGALWTKLCLADVSMAPEDEDTSEVYQMAAAHFQYMGEMVRGEKLAQQAVEVLERIGLTKRPSYGAALNTLAAAYDMQGKRTEAIATYRRAIAVLEQYFGPDGRQVAGPLTNMALALSDDRQHAEAIAAARRAAALTDRWDSARSGGMLLNLGSVLINAGENAEAQQVLERACAALTNGFGPDHIDVAFCLNNLGLLAQDERKLDAALDYYQRAVAIAERGLGPDHPDLRLLVGNVGDVLRHLHRPREALPYLERSVALFEPLTGDPQVAVPLTSLGMTLLDLGRIEEALPYLERAKQIRDVSNAAPPALALTLVHHAEALAALGRIDEAEAEHERVVALLATIEEPERAVVELVAHQKEAFAKVRAHLKQHAPQR